MSKMAKGKKGKGKAPRMTRPQAPRRQPETTLGIDELRYLNAVTNPFGNGGADVAQARIPDGLGGSTVGFSFQGEDTFTAGTRTRGLFKLLAPKFTDTFYTAITATGLLDTTSPSYQNNNLIRAYGSAAGAAAPTESENMIPLESMNAAASMAMTSSGQYRVVGAGIKVRAISAPDNTSGVLQGGNANRGGALSYSFNAATPGALQSTWEINTYRDYDYVTDQLESTLFPVSEGLTCRKDIAGRHELEYSGLSTSSTTSGTFNDESIYMPCVYFDGLSAGTVLLIQGVIHCEYIVRRNDVPIPVRLSPTSNKFEILLALVNDASESPIVVRGNSFWSWTKKATKRAWRFLKGIAPELVAGAVGLEFPELAPFVEQGLTTGLGIIEGRKRRNPYQPIPYSAH